MKFETIQIESQYITLAQFLKFVNIVGSGGEAKLFLSDIDVFYNGELENRKGKKIYHGDEIVIPDIEGYFIISSQESDE